MGVTQQGSNPLIFRASGKHRTSRPGQNRTKDNKIDKVNGYVDVWGD